MKNILRIIFTLIFSFNFAMAINAYFSDINGVKIVESFIPESNTDFNISLDSNITNEVNLSCEFIDITTSSDDFTHGNVTISFEVNQTHTTLPLTIISDNIYEDNETFTMKLRDSNNTLLHEINVTILNNDPLPSISIANKSFGECNSTNKTYTFPITINNKTDRNISFDINSTEVSADSLDFNSINKTFTIEPSEWSLGSITKDLNVTILCDSIYEKDESFNLKVSNIINTTSSQNEANITIIEDDPIPTISVTPIAHSIMESNAILTFDFNLSHLSKFDINISLDLNKTQSWFLTANEGSDYTLSSYNINFPSGTDKAELNISIVDDNYYEFNESVRFDLNLTGEANSTRDYIQINIYQDSDPEFIVTQSLKDGTNLSNIFVTDMVTFKVGVTNNSDYNMSNIEIWDDIDISLEKNITSLSAGTFNTYKVIGQANGYMFNIDSLQKDETKYLYIDVNVTEPSSTSLSDSTILYSNLAMDNNHSTFNYGDILRISKFSNTISVDTNFTNANINNEYLNYTPLSSPNNEANTTFYAKQYLMDIKALKDTNLSKDSLELNDTLGFTIDVNNEYTFTPEVANGLLLGDTISDALILPNQLDGLNNLYGYYIFNLDATNTKALKFDTTPKQSGNIAGIYDTTINCAEVITTYNKRFYDFNLTNNKDCVELNNTAGLLIKGSSSDTITIKGYEFDGCSLNSRGTSTHPHVSSSIVNAHLSKGKYPLGDPNYDGMGGKYCFGATIDTNSYIVVNDMLSEGNGTFDTLSQLTVTNWFYPTNLSNSNDERVILSRENSYYLTVKETGTTSDKINFYIHKDNFSQNTLDLIQTIENSAPSTFSGYFSQSGDYYKFEFNTTINPDSWYYLGFLYDGNSSSNISDINLSDPSSVSATCPTNTTTVEPLICKKKGTGTGNDKINLRFCNKGALHGNNPNNNSTYIYHDIDKISSFPHYLFYCGDDNVSGDSLQLYLVQENGSLAPSTNPFANFLPKELINNTSNFYMYKDNDGKIGITGYAENIEIYFNQSLEQTIIDNFNNYNTTLNDNNKKECRLCATSHPEPYSKIFDKNISGEATVIGASILTNSSTQTQNDTATMSINNTNSQDNLNLGQKLELPNSSEILFAKLYWQGAILFDTSKKYIKELYSPKRNIDLYKNISFYINDVNTTLNQNDINCNWFGPARYVYNKAKPVTYDCNGSWYSPTGNTGTNSHDRVCLGDLIKIPATNATGSVSFMPEKDALYYQCSIDVTNKISPNATYKVTDILTTPSNSNEYESVGGTFGGWALSVAYDNNAKKFKRVTLFDGFEALDNDDRIIDNFTFTYPFLIDGFETNASGDVNASLILFASEGDNGWLGDSISINGKSSAYLNSNDPLNSTLKNSFDKTYLGLDIDKFDLTNKINNSESEANISLNIEVSETTIEADNYFLGFVGLNTELGEDVCYETTVKKVGATSFDTFANLGEVKETDELIFKVNATNRGFYSKYLAINKFLEETSSLEFECICDNNGVCETSTPDYADVTSILNDKNLTFKLGSGANLNSGGFLSKGTTSSDIYFKAKVGFYKNGHSYLFDYDKYRYRDKNITTFENLGYCSSEPKLNFEDLSLKLSGSFSPNQVFPSEDSTLTVKLKNNSSFEGADLNLTISFYNLNSFGISDVYSILKDGTNSITTPAGWTYKGYLNANDKTTLYFVAEQNLSVGSTIEFKFNIQAPNQGGTLKTTTVVKSPMIVESPVSKNINLSIIDLKAEYRFDECYLGARGDGTSMAVIDNANGNYNATAYDSNTTDSESKICRVGDFSKNSTSDYVLLDSNLLHNLRTFTISLWVKTNLTSQQAILSGANSSNSNEVLMFINGSKLNIYTDGKTLSYNKNIRDNNWHHIVWARSGKNNYVYIDNVAYSNQQTTNNNKVNLPSGGLMLGQEQDSVGGGFDINQDLEGYLDEVKFFNTRLYTTTVNRIYTNELNNRNCSNDTIARSCQICYPKKYSFTTDNNGICGDRNGEDVNLTLLNSDNSEFKFISPNDNIVDYDTIYPTLAYFDLNLSAKDTSSNLMESNITFELNTYYLPSSIRVDEVNKSFTFYNSCGDKCSNSSSINLKIENILQFPIVGSSSESVTIDYTNIDRYYYFKYYNGATISNKFQFGGDTIALMDSLGKSYNFYMEFNESDTGKAVILTGVTDSSYYQNLVESGFSTTIDSLTDTQSDTQNITFTTPNNKLGLSTATIKVENSNNFCADGIYSVEVLTKPSKFAGTLDGKIFDLIENTPFTKDMTLKYDKNLSLNIFPICSNSPCNNNLKNYLISNATTYFTEINATDTNDGSAIKIDINQSIGSGGEASYHKTEWGDDGNFTKLYFENNNLDSAIYYNNTINNKLVDLNFTLSYFKLYNIDGSYYRNSGALGAIYGAGILAKFVKGPDHLVATSTCENKCGSSCEISIIPKDEANATVDWSGYQVNLKYNVISNSIYTNTTVTIRENPIQQTPESNSTFTYHLDTSTSTCCPDVQIEIIDIELRDPNGDLINTLTNKKVQMEANSLDSVYNGKTISFTCPKYSFLALEDNSTINTTLSNNDNNVSLVDRNITTKIANDNLNFLLLSYWDDNGTLIDFPITLRASIIDRSSSDNPIYPQTSPNYTLVNLTTPNIGKNSWSIANTAFSNSAYRYLAIRMVEDGNLTHTAQSDPFAIRPNNFNLDITSNSARAGEDFNMNLSAVNGASSVITNYNEREVSTGSFKLDVNLTHDGVFNQIDLSLSDDFNYTGEGTLSFSSGQIQNLQTAILEVGRFDINITDGNGSYENSPTNCSSCVGESDDCTNQDGCPYACIDITSNSCSGLSTIDMANDIIVITPFEYNITSNFNPTNWIYMANVNDLNVEINATILAQNILHQTTQNFTTSIFNGGANLPNTISVNTDINLTINNTNSEFEVNGSKIINATSTEIVNSQLTITDTNLTPIFNLSSTSHFLNGEANISYLFNIDRNVSNPLNPIQFQLNDINTTNNPSPYSSANNLGYSGSSTQNITFYYGRMYSPNYDFDTLSATTFPITISSEFYRDNNGINYASIQETNTYYGGHWYRNHLDSSSKVLNLRANNNDVQNSYDGNITIVGASNPQEKTINMDLSGGKVPIDITADSTSIKNYPHKTRFFLNVANYLWYEPYPRNGTNEINDENDSYSQPSFSINFTDSTTNDKWSNTQGQTLDSNASAIRRIEW